MHFYESSMITTKNGLHCQVYGNEHPVGSILVKPKYIPTDLISSNALKCRFISGKKMNRLNLWADKEELKKYIEEFKKAYPNYIFKSPLHKCIDKEQKDQHLFFSIPVDSIERIYFPRRGLSELMSMPKNALDDHLKLVYEFVDLLLKSGLRMKDLGITYSTLMGHYMSNISDINIVVYGKENYWKLMEFLENAIHPLLKWKTPDDWKKFYNKRNRSNIFQANNFVQLMSRKKSEGFFGGSLFVIFAAEKEEEVWFKWGDEKYTSLGQVTVKGRVKDDFSSVVRPGCYEIESIETEKNLKEIKKVVFYSRDYCMLAKKGEKIEVSGLLEKVEPTNPGGFEPYFRVVVGYFGAYISDRREKEYIRVEN